MKKIFSLLLLLLLGLPNLALAFSDVSSTSAFSTSISWLVQNKIVKGYPDGTFKPDATVKRSELLKIVFLSLGLDQEAEKAKLELTPQTIGFKDVKVDAWYAPYVYLAKKRGSVGGYSDNTFRPDNPVKRSEGFKIILSEFYNNKVDFTGYDPLVSDVSKTDWYYKYANSAAEKHLIDGSVFNGESAMTRGDVAELTYRTKAVIDRAAKTFTANLTQKSIAQTATVKIYTKSELLGKVEKALPEFTAVNITQAGNYVFFFAYDPNASDTEFSWYQLSLTASDAKAMKLSESPNPSHMFQGAASPDGKEFVLLNDKGLIQTVDTEKNIFGTLGTFAYEDSARYTAPIFTPDGKYLLLLDQVKQGLLTVNALTKDFVNPKLVLGFWLKEAGGITEHGESYPTYTFLDNSRVKFQNDAILNLTTMQKE